MTKAILFDADGVLIITDMFSKMYTRDFNVPNEKMLPFFKSKFQSCITGKSDLKKEIKPYLKDWKWDKSVDEFLEYWFKAEHNIDDRVVKVITELKKAGIKCYAATNQEKYRTKYLKEEIGFDKIFDKVYSSAEIGFKKPQLEYFDYILNDLKLPKNQVEFWDDEPINVEGANQYGLKGHIYNDFAEFNKTIKKLL